MGTERQTCCGALTRTYADAGNRQHEPGCKYEVVATTKTGRQMTNKDFEALADEAERGYDVSHLTERKP